ncbi:natural product biosynthesis luciferase-like monooxygenase domain-containing protein [Ruegeria halocynthiae]|uniref:Natural product biosynthesis luciferase-like monooxygenase domain-containing protein n=1 Tax=Ruegeria halocynthiae TaxID=985054 RepID=A0A1H2Y336_9RHOB|nr:MupA/Atu3671 family FMN-dependent luciferase-like monooxygenase [Ruegeria halocynthiae]SDW99546.1 natural product biosynthesis luciferase-like monooxygenase domain-containing protein [Ruegeria halocynthiae]
MSLSTFLIGHESLVIQCGEMLLEAGHSIQGVATRNSDVEDWAKSHSLPFYTPGPDLLVRIEGAPFDWLFSIANLDLLPQPLLDKAQKGAVNFHDGPLPRYAGLNAPVWAILNGETQHGITWHMISGGVDEGGIVAQNLFDISDNETALTLNTKCYGAAIESFSDVILALETGQAPAPQDLSQRSYFAKNDRPEAAARLDFAKPARELVSLVRALDHGDYWNPLCRPKVERDGHIWLIGSARVNHQQSDAAPGTILASSAESLTVATGEGALEIGNLQNGLGTPVPTDGVLNGGSALPTLTAEQTVSINQVITDTLTAEPEWRARLETLQSVDIPLINSALPSGAPRSQALHVPAGLAESAVQAALATLMSRLGDASTFDLALCLNKAASPYLNSWVPVRFTAEQTFADAQQRFDQSIIQACELGPFACDLPARLPGVAPLQTPVIGLADAISIGLIPGTSLTLATSDGQAMLFADSGHVSEAALHLFAARLENLLASLSDPLTADQPIAELPIIPETERTQILMDWNNTSIAYDETTCVHEHFEAQVERTPDAPALVFENLSFSYSELNALANQVAHVLRELDVGPDTLVGLHVKRSPLLLIGALGILKAGGAYVPMDPAYPADRTALYLEDSGAKVVLTESALASGLPAHGAQPLLLDTDERLGSAPTDNVDSGVTSSNLAYLIYTSGSTGRPKGVMVEHRNVSNFFTGMDDRISYDPAGVWLAVTSLSFDISVLELFWTLARGFKLVLSDDENRALVAGDSAPGKSITGKGMEFSLFYWGNDDGVGRDKYKLLLEGARFGDQNGFCAVWTPERHFHAFGGPYPNPSVTGAAVAAVTENIGVRAGSCVAPLHHTARISEEWAVIDNLTNGRAGLAIASGWQPDDFVLRPENTPPENKPAMLEAINTLRQLWAGEMVEFPTKSGDMHGVVTQPRPVSKTLPVWVTTAGNPDTWREAGAIGANVLTHLLGQSVQEVADKIGIYHTALREAGYDPDDYKVTLMLHTYVGQDREEVREVAREPMKDYLRSAAGLIKQYAWAFPAFKKPKGVSNPFQLDLGSLSEDEMEGILDFAFLRYFEDSGLFGTLEDCLNRVEELKRIGVDEIACLIDYGISVAQVMEGLKPLAEVLRLSNQGTELAEDDYSIATQIIRHKVSHLQCTPSMAQMILMSDEARFALSKVKHIMIGGEALPGSLVKQINKLSPAHIENMYGPTETTIWSTTETATAAEGVVNVGTPIANTQVYVLDEDMNPVPIGMAGELYIGGAGVTRGYWQREDLIAERFLPDPFSEITNARLYRTGDLVRWRTDGRLDFLGRADLQIKLRGYRIELGEIESLLDAQSGVRQSVVIAREDTPNLVQLAAYMTVDQPVDEKILRQALASKLPEYMVPTHFVTLGSFPLTPNRKVDRKALPAPVDQKPQVTPGAAAPVSGGSVAQKIAAIWSQLLGVSDISGRDNFFDLGGHSLLAVQAHREIRKDLNVPNLSITDVFRFPTLSALAETVEKKTGVKSTETASAQPSPDKASSRSDAMARRREMRARRRSA